MHLGIVVAEEITDEPKHWDIESTKEVNKDCNIAGVLSSNVLAQGTTLFQEHLQYQKTFLDKSIYVRHGGSDNSRGNWRRNPYHHCRTCCQDHIMSVN